MIAVVRLDNARVGAGPGTVVEITEDDVRLVLRRYTDRDGARPDDIRFWRAAGSLAVGDRVVAAQEAVQC